jgi:hypothetical protein
MKACPARCYLHGSDVTRITGHGGTTGIALNDPLHHCAVLMPEIRHQPRAMMESREQNST